MKKTSLFAFLLALLLFVACTPEEAADNAEQTEAETGLENGDFSAELNGFNIHYQVRGSGPACIALTNSWGFTSDGVRAVLKSLENHLTMVYFDPRGMGQSDDIKEPADMGIKAVREDANALRQHLELEKAIFIGWSNGGGNLLAYASEYADTVEAAIVLHSAAHFSMEDMQAMGQEHPELFSKFMAFQQEMATSEATEEEKTEKLKALYINESFPYMYADKEMGKTVIAEAFGDLEYSFAHFMYSSGEGMNFDAREGLPNITAPTLLIAGAQDMVPPERIEEVANAIPNATFVLFENSGHFAPLEETDKFIATVLEFLKIK